LDFEPEQEIRAAASLVGDIKGKVGISRTHFFLLLSLIHISPPLLDDHLLLLLVVLFDLGSPFIDIRGSGSSHRLSLVRVVLRREICSHYCGFDIREVCRYPVVRNALLVCRSKRLEGVFISCLNVSPVKILLIS
jgi:hypothetical protein